MLPLLIAAAVGVAAVATAMATRKPRRGRTDRAATRRTRRKKKVTPVEDVAPTTPPLDDVPPEPPKPAEKPGGKKPSAAATKKDAAKVAQHKVKLEKTPDVKPKDAATSLYKFVSLKIRKEEFGALGTKAKPSVKVRRDQRAMRNLKTDGIYGDKTRARGTELLGKPFPARRIQRKDALPPPEPKPIVFQDTAPAPDPQQPPAPPPIEETVRDPELVTPLVEWLNTHAGQYKAQIREKLGLEGSDDPPLDILSLCQAIVEVLPGELIDKLELDYPAIVPELALCERPATTTTPTVAPADAAATLYSYVRSLRKKGRSAALGLKGRPNVNIEQGQAGMGELKVDGIYGDETRARGRQLLNKYFPRR